MAGSPSNSCACDPYEGWGSEVSYSGLFMPQTAKVRRAKSMETRQKMKVDTSNRRFAVFGLQTKHLNPAQTFKNTRLHCLK